MVNCVLLSHPLHRQTRNRILQNQSEKQMRDQKLTLGPASGVHRSLDWMSRSLHMGLTS